MVPASITARAVCTPVPSTVSGAPPVRSPAFSAAASSTPACSLVAANGFSPYTCLPAANAAWAIRSEEHTSELQSRGHLVCRLLLEKKKYKTTQIHHIEVTIEATNHTRRP